MKRNRDSARHCFLPRPGKAVLVAAAVAAFSPAAFAQAWVPPAGVGSVGILMQQVEHSGHVLEDGSTLRGYDSTSRTALFTLDYAFSDRFSITTSAAYVGARYDGPEPSFFGIESDDCHCWQSGFQDASLTVRYNLFNDAFALTPSITYGMPTRSYPYFGEAVIGRNLDELRLAVDAGARLDAISPRLYATGNYSYAFVEKVIGIGTDRSDAMMSVGYMASPRLSLSGEIYVQRVHGGLSSTEFVTDEQWAQFDRLLKDNSVHVGITVSYSLELVDLYGSYVDFVDGTDTHDGHAFTIGIGWPFQL